MVADVAHQLCPQTTFLSSGQKSGGYILWLHKNSPLAFEQAICSTPGRIRTSNPRFRRPVLYPVELRMREA